MNVPLSRYWDLLGGYIMLQKGRFLLLTVLLLSTIGLQLVNPQIVGYFIDAALAGETGSVLVVAALAFIGFALLQQVCGVSATYVGEDVAWTATNALRADLASHCLHLDMSFHNEHTAGELIERIDGDVQQLSNFFSQMVIRVLGNLLLLFGILFVLFMEDWRLGVAFAIFVFVALWALNRVRGVAILFQKALRQAIADFFGFLEEQLSGTEDIRSSGAIDFVILRLYRLNFAILGHWRKTSMHMLIVHATGGILLAVGTALAFVAGYNLFKSGLITVGTAYVIVFYTNLLRRPIRELTQQIENLQNIGASTERLSDLRGVKSKIQDGPGADLPRGSLSLEFDKVSFSYVDNDRVLQDLSFRMEPGTVTGLLGRTGSGKTTLSRLVFRLYDPTSGRIKLGDVDIRHAQLRDLRQHVAIVTQDVQLFQASVRDNLTFFDQSIPDDQIRQVIELLELEDWYRALPKGLDTRLDTSGRSLSAGEAQLLAFTRVFLRDPGLVILDEASSRLDPATEARIERAVDRLLRNRTAIVVAHRLGTVQRADHIMILEKGHIAEHGERQRLAGDPTSRFYGLLQTGLEEVLA